MIAVVHPKGQSRRLNQPIIELSPDRAYETASRLRADGIGTIPVVVHGEAVPMTNSVSVGVIGRVFGPARDAMSPRSLASRHVHAQVSPCRQIIHPETLP
jgi:hypothetical protein